MARVDGGRAAGREAAADDEADGGDGGGDAHRQGDGVAGGPAEVVAERHDDADGAGAEGDAEVVEQLQRRRSRRRTRAAGAQRSVSCEWAA